jgi:hypothetical protein
MVAATVHLISRSGRVEADDLRLDLRRPCGDRSGCVAEELFAFCGGLHGFGRAFFFKRPGSGGVVKARGSRNTGVNRGTGRAARPNVDYNLPLLKRYRLLIVDGLFDTCGRPDRAFLWPGSRGRLSGDNSPLHRSTEIVRFAMKRSQRSGGEMETPHQPGFDVAALIVWRTAAAGGRTPMRQAVNAVRPPCAAQRLACTRGDRRSGASVRPERCRRCSPRDRK